MRPAHPGEILREEIDTTGVCERTLSQALDVPLNEMIMILEGRQGITAATAMRFARFCGTTPGVWLNLRQTWELRPAETEVGVVARAYRWGLATRGLGEAVSNSWALPRSHCSKARTVNASLFLRRAHSHTIATRQSASRSRRLERRSRSTLPSNLVCQKSVLVAGVVAYGHPGWRCQKQP